MFRKLTILISGLLVTDLLQLNSQLFLVLLNATARSAYAYNRNQITCNTQLSILTQKII